MKIHLPDGLLVSANYLPSPHCDSRPADMPIDMIVVHNISLPPNQFDRIDFIEQFFCGKLDLTAHPYFASIASLKVSSHLLIDRKGKFTQFVPFAKRAWHAGQSFFQGQERCNDFSIGIELVGADDVPFEKEQYESLAAVILQLMKTYPTITRERIVGHSDIAPGRKTDPGPAFDWNFLNRYMECVT